MMISNRVPMLALLLLSKCALAFAQLNPGVEPPRLALMERRDAIVRETQTRLQGEILDRVLGPGKASVWVDVELDIKASRKENLRAGSGSAEKNKVKMGESEALKTAFVLPGVPRPKSITTQEKPQTPEAAQAQSAQQARVEQEEIFSQEPVFKSFRVVVVHDAEIVSSKLDELRRLIVEAMAGYKLRPDDVRFEKANYHKERAMDWIDGLKDPKVYIPLLYALLFLLLLSFLFGPFARFLRRYTEALMAKPAAEVNVESTIEAPEADGGGDGEEETLSAIDLMVGRKPPEPPPPPIEAPVEIVDEEEEMEKLEVFTYINEENLKRLANLFLLRSEEPWLIAVVLSYLKQEYARQVLASLPVEIQAKVALEALKIRQVTKEQILAIDADVKASIDYVVGGVERLIQMLEEADPRTRRNILESIQNEKPAVYEHVRRSIFLFDDIAGFEDRDMQIIVRALKTETMSRALHGATPETVNKFFNNMSAGAASLLKESMEYQQNINEGQIEEARAEVMSQIKTFHKEGKVNLAKSGGAGESFHQIVASESVRGKRLSQLSGESERSEAASAAPAASPVAVVAPPPAIVDPAAARGHLNSGAEAQQKGDLESAVKEYRRAMELDPGLWDSYQYMGQALYLLGRRSESVMYYERYLQFNPDPQLKAWVDGFKTQMGAS